MTKTIVCLIIGVSAVAPLYQSAAGPLTSAEVTKIINHVNVIDPRKGDHTAEVRDVIKDDLGLLTGTQSRSELLFQDNTLTRFGAETFFSFKTGTRDMTLERGSMLLQVPKGLGGAKIRTAAVTAAITGTTIMMEYMPKQYIKVLVLEGSLRLSRNGVFGDSLVLHPGKMVLMRPDAKKIPDPVDVDLQHVVQTSSLVNFPGSEPLPSMSLIQAAVQEQTKQFAKNNLVPTNLVMGHGTNVVVASANQIAQVFSQGGILGTAMNGPAAGLKSTGLPLALAGSAVSGSGLAPAAATTVVSNVLNSATGTVSSLASGLPATVTSISVPGTTVSNLLNSAGGAIGAVSPNLSGAIPVSSSSQLISLVANAAPSASGIIAIPPPTAPSSPTVATVSSATATASSPNVSSVSPATAGSAGSTSSTVPAASASTVPVASSSTTSSVTPSVLSTVASAPITVASVSVTNPSSTITSASLKNASLR